MHYYRQKPDIYLELPVEYNEILKDTQEEFKTIKKSEVKEELEEILNRKYCVLTKQTNRGTTYHYISNKEYFLQQLNGNGNYNQYTVNGVMHTLSVIPVTYISAIITYKKWDSRHRSMFKDIFTELGWKHTSIRIDKEPFPCWVNCKNDNTDNTDNTKITLGNNVEELF